MKIPDSGFSQANIEMPSLEIESRDKIEQARLNATMRRLSTEKKEMQEKTQHKMQ